MADVSVRPARPQDAERIARVQLETWRAAYAEVLPPEALALPDDVPLITVDARDRGSAKRALVRITEFALTRLANASRKAVI